MATSKQKNVEVGISQQIRQQTLDSLPPASKDDVDQRTSLRTRRCSNGERKQSLADCGVKVGGSQHKRSGSAEPRFVKETAISGEGQGHSLTDSTTPMSSSTPSSGTYLVVPPPAKTAAQLQWSRDNDDASDTSSTVIRRTTLTGDGNSSVSSSTSFRFTRSSAPLSLGDFPKSPLLASLMMTTGVGDNSTMKVPILVQSATTTTTAAGLSSPSPTSSSDDPKQSAFTASGVSPVRFRLLDSLLRMQRPPQMHENMERQDAKSENTTSETGATEIDRQALSSSVDDSSRPGSQQPQSSIRRSTYPRDGVNPRPGSVQSSASCGEVDVDGGTDDDDNDINTERRGSRHGQLQQLFEVRQERIDQRRVVSVEREHCLKKEKAEFSVLRAGSGSDTADVVVSGTIPPKLAKLQGGKAGPRAHQQHHRAVTISRSQTWSFRDKAIPAAALRGERKLMPHSNLDESPTTDTGGGDSMSGDGSSDFSEGSVSCSYQVDEPESGALTSGPASAPVRTDTSKMLPRCFSMQAERPIVPIRRRPRTTGGGSSNRSSSVDADKMASSFRSTSTCLLMDYDTDKSWSYVPWVDQQSSAGSGHQSQLGLLGKESSKDINKDRTRDRSRDKLLKLGGDSKLTEQRDSVEEQCLTQKSAIVQRGEKGYGFTVSGDNPVFVQSVRENGAAAKAGVLCGDRIIKVNGTLVTSCNHLDVVKMIKSGPFVSLTLLGRPVAGTVPGCTPKHLEESSAAASIPADPASASVVGAASLLGTLPGPLTGNPVLDRERISSPQAVDHEKDLEYKAQKLETYREMYRRLHDEYEEIKREYQRNSTDQVQTKLEAKLQTLRRVENQLKQLESQTIQEDSWISHGPSNSKTVLSSSVPKASAAIGPRHRRTESMPESLLKMNEATAAAAAAIMSRDCDSIGRGGGKVSDTDSNDVLKNRNETGGRQLHSGLLATTVQPEEFTEGVIQPLAVSDALSSPHGTTTHLPGEQTDVASSTVPSGQQQQQQHQHQHQQSWKIGVNLRRPKLKIVLPNQVRVMTMEDPDFSTQLSSTAPVRPSGPGALPLLDSGSGGSGPQVNVMSMEDDEFGTDDEHLGGGNNAASSTTSERLRRRLKFAKAVTEVVTPVWSQIEEPSVFSDLNQLKSRPAHLAVFLHYLLSNSDPSSLLFYLITEFYPQGTTKDLRKWAYEIHSTFLCNKAPLKLAVDDTSVSAVDGVLHYQSEKEDALKAVFLAARNFAQNEICDLLSDFRQKRSLGLGSIYGDHELRDVMDRQAEHKIIDSALWKHFERLAQDEESDRSQALASALASFFRHVGFTKNSTLFERCPTFNSKDRKVLRFMRGSKKIHAWKNHQFMAQQYFTTTYCKNCHGIIWGIGNQGYQCANCDQNVHKNCIERVEVCSAGASTVSSKKERKTRPPSVFSIISRKPSANNPAAIKEAERLHEEKSRPPPVPVPPTTAVHTEDYDDDESAITLRGQHQQQDTPYGVPRALSMPSVRDVGRPPKQSTSSHVLKVKSERQESPELAPSAGGASTRVNKLVARYSDLSKGALTSPFDEVKVTTTASRGHSPERAVLIPPAVEEPDEEVHTPDSPSNVNLGRSESLHQRAETRTSSVRRAHSDVHPDEVIISTVVTSGNSSNSSLSASGESANNSNDGLSDIAPTTSHRPSSFSLPAPSSAIPTKFSQPRLFNDAEFETETELPNLEAIIPKELLRKLKPKEKKRQEVINELFYTEKTHVRNLRVMQRIFYQPMREEGMEIADVLLPNIDEVFEVHSELNKEFQQKRNDSPVVGDFADVFLNRFSAAKGEEFKEVLSKFCMNQSHALEELRLKQRKDQKFANFLQESASHPHCRRLELKDLIPTVMQRLTKYPLLIENLLKYTQSNTPEYDTLVRAQECSKDILNQVNRAVQECENRQRLEVLKRRLDKRPVENSAHPVIVEYKNLDVTQHRMLHEGPLTWRISRAKQIDLHVVLLDDILLLLQRQDERLVLRCQNTTVVAGKDDTKLTHSPIIKLTNLLTRNVATDKRAFFLVSTSDVGPQIYELVASSKDEKNKWFKHITDAADAYKGKDAGRNRKQSGQQTHPPTSADSQLSDTVSSSGSSIIVSRSESDKLSRLSYDHDASDDKDAHNTSGGSVESLETIGQGVEVLHIEAPRLVQPNEVVVSRTVCIEKLDPIVSPAEMLNLKCDLISRTLAEKKLLMADILQIPAQDYDHIAEMVDEVAEPKEVKELLLSTVTQADLLTQLINERLAVENVVNTHPADDVLVTTERTNVPDTSMSSNPASGELLITVPGTRLLSISTRLHRSLTLLVEATTRLALENERLRSELGYVQGQLAEIHAAASTEELRSLRSRSNSQSLRDDNVTTSGVDPTATVATHSGEDGGDSRPQSFVSVMSSASESNDSSAAERLAMELNEESDHVQCTTASLVTVPVVTERLEIIEAVSQPFVVDPSAVIVSSAAVRVVGGDVS